jgi:peptidoglycan/xylan/chitin deacetylase (PgdA/CDA1 family)
MSRSAASQTRFVVTVDDAGGLIQDLEQFHRARSFFEAEGAPATFFAVPRGAGDWQMDRQAEWLAAAREAQRQGHDFQLHGLDHGTCEFGPYPPFVRALSREDPMPLLEQDRQKYGHLWRRDLFVERLNAAIRVFTDAFGRRPDAFRGGALSQSPELHQALADVGMRYVSNKVVDPRGWKYIVEEYDEPGDWDPEVPPAPYRLTEDIVNLPIISEYAWYLTPEKIEPHLALAIEDLRRVYEAEGVFILVCHVQCVGAEDSYARDLLHRLLKAARRDYQVRFQTIRELVADIESGEVQVLEGGHTHGH